MTVHVTCMQTALRVHKNLCTVLIPLCKNNLNLRSEVEEAELEFLRTSL